MKLSIVVPVFNSEDNLNKLCLQINEALIEYDYEIVLVDDCSKDNSWEKIIGLSERYKNIIALSFVKNFGQDNAIMAGLINSTGDYIVIMDDDLQHSPYDIQKLLDKCQNGYDVCYGNYSLTMNQTWWKKIGSYINSKQAEYVISKPKEIYLSPFKIINKITRNSIINYKGPYPYVDGLIFRSTNNISQVNVQHYSRNSGEGNYNLKKSIALFFRHSTGFSVLPLRIAAISGSLIALVSFLYAVYCIYDYYSNGIEVEGWTTLIVVQLFLGGMILLSMGILGEYIGRAYLTLNNAPQFSIRKFINKN